MHTKNITKKSIYLTLNFQTYKKNIVFTFEYDLDDTNDFD